MADLRSSSPLTWFVDPFAPTAAHERATWRGSRLAYLAPLGAGVLLLLVGLVGWLTDAYLFFFSYLVAWAFCISVSLGAMGWPRIRCCWSL